MFDNFLLNQLQAKVDQIEPKNQIEHSEIKYRIEQVIKDQNDKFDALLDYLGLKICPPNNGYKVIKHEKE